LDNFSWKFKTTRDLAGAGIQTAALAFGGILDLLQEQQKNMMEQLGHQVEQFKYSKICFSRLWNTNSSISFWWWSTYTGATEEYDGSSWTYILLV
jgi:hypothetical protein